MKINISSLLVTIASFLHFCELNAIIRTRNEQGSSAGDGLPTRFITYKNRSFALWDSSDGTFVHKVRLQPRDYMSDCAYHLEHGFGIEYVDEQGVQFLVIKTGEGLFLGAVAGKISPKPPGRPTLIVYKGHQLGLWKRRGVAYEVHLLPKNFVPFTSFFGPGNFQTYSVYKDGIWILVHAIHRKILGVELWHDTSAG